MFVSKEIRPTLAVFAARATLVPAGAALTSDKGAGVCGPGKGVSPEQEKARQSANLRSSKPDPFFEGGRKW